MPPVGGSTPVGVIDVVRRLVMQASVALRAIPRVIGIFAGPTDPTAIIPSASGARWWLQRLGLFALQETLEVADDWVYLIDHSVQIGTVKVCVILGLRLSELPSPARPLWHEDVRLLATIPTESSTGEVVAEQLQQTAQRTGIPREIVSDHGSDVKKGSELFAARQPHTAVVYDAAHHGACVLKRCFAADPVWADFLGQLNQTKARIQQTADAYLMSPSLRQKARDMNLASVLRWCRSLLALLDRGAAGGSASARPGPLRLAAAVPPSDRAVVALGIDRAWQCRVRPHTRFVARLRDRAWQTLECASVSGTSRETGSRVERIRPPTKRDGSTRRAAGRKH